MQDYPEKFKQRCRDFVQDAVHMGYISKSLTCENCREAPAVHGHHDDYMQPLKVRWLCHKCHAAYHGDERCNRNIRKSIHQVTFPPGCMTAWEFAELTGMNYGTLISRLNRGAIKGTRIRIGSKNRWIIDPDMAN